MASLFRRSNGIYYFATYHQGRRIWRSTGKHLRRDALRFLGELSVSSEETEEVTREHPTPGLTFSKFILQWRTYAGTSFAPSTVRLYNDTIKNLTRILGDRELRRYSPLDMEKFKAERLKEVSPSKTNIDFTNVKAMFNVAVKWGMLDENPCKGVKLVKVPPQRPAYLSEEEFSRLIQSIQAPWLRDIVSFAVSTMMRAGEIANLTWESVDLEKRFIHVENTEGFRVKTTKPRAVPMNEWVYNFLARKNDRSGYVFRLPDGSRTRVDCISKNFKKACRKISLPERLHFHSLRHTGATWLVQKGVSIYAVQRLLGHSNIQVTMMYSHLITSEMQDSVNHIVIPDNLALLQGASKSREVI
jgi:integrase